MFVHIILFAILIKKCITKVDCSTNTFKIFTECPIIACDIYALNNIKKKTPCISSSGSRSCIIEYNLGGKIAMCNSVASKRLTGGKPILC